MAKASSWKEDQLIILYGMWGGGESMTAIAKAFDVKKNRVVAKINTDNLFGEEGRQRAKEKAEELKNKRKAEGLPEVTTNLPAVVQGPKQLVKDLMLGDTERNNILKPVLPNFVPAGAPEESGPVFKTCQFIHGNTGTPDFYYCGKTDMGTRPDGRRSPYCREHTKICYNAPPRGRPPKSSDSPGEYSPRHRFGS